MTSFLLHRVAVAALRCAPRVRRQSHCAAFLVLALALIFFPRNCVAGQEASGRLSALKGSGSQRFSSEKIAAGAGLTLGQEIKKEDLQAAANRLAQLGVFSDVRYRFSTQGSAIEVELQVADAPSIAPLFDNFP